MEGEYICVEDLIKSLLKCDMSWEVQVKRDGKKLENTQIVAVKPEGLVCLFG
ncbi:hypothetical protein LCGC14_2373300 [marine sediment metagenome]|uniref:Uncharacterized protein n=1 Tax=marine sediment metagenome TaxID=412755 RepID=A0A0F9CQC5_9ZZZZ